MLGYAKDVHAEAEQPRNLTLLLDDDDQWAKALESEASKLPSTDAAAATLADAAAAAAVGLRDLAYITFSSAQRASPSPFFARTSALLFVYCHASSCIRTARHKVHPLKLMSRSKVLNGKV